MKSPNPFHLLDNLSSNEQVIKQSTQASKRARVSPLTDLEVGYPLLVKREPTQNQEFITTWKKPRSSDLIELVSYEFTGSFFNLSFSGLAVIEIMGNKCNIEGTDLNSLCIYFRAYSPDSKRNYEREFKLKSVISKQVYDTTDLIKVSLDVKLSSQVISESKYYKLNTSNSSNKVICDVCIRSMNGSKNVAFAGKMSIKGVGIW
jgi:hypothetical protein